MQITGFFALGLSIMVMYSGFWNLKAMLQEGILKDAWKDNGNKNKGSNE